MTAQYLTNTASNIAHTIQDCYKALSNSKIEQLCGLVLNTKGTEFYTKAIALHSLAVTSPQSYLMEIDCLTAEYPIV